MKKSANVKSGGGLPPPNATGQAPITATARKAKGAGKNPASTPAPAATASATTAGTSATAQAAATVTPPATPAVVAAPAATTAQPAPVNTVVGTPAPAATAAAVATPAPAVTAPANTAGANAPVVVATAAVTAASAAANTAGTAAAANPHWKRIVMIISLISVLVAIWPVVKWVRSHSAPAAVSTDASALYEEQKQEIANIRKEMEAMKKAQTNQVAVTNVQTQVKSNVPPVNARSEWPSIKGIEGDNNDRNNIVMVYGPLHVTTGSYNGSDATVRSAVKAGASAVMIPGNGLPPGCNKIREFDMSKMSFQPGKVTNLPAIEMVQGEYIRVILPPYPWNCKGVWYSSGKVLTSRNGSSCESGPVAGNTDDNQQPNVSELGYWLEQGTTNGRLELRVY